MSRKNASPMSSIRFHGFTLAELLISLVILGVIAVFTIPKILAAQQNQQYNALAKEGISIVASAYSAAQLQGSITTNSGIASLTPYMNYVATDSASTIDDYPGNTTVTCTGSSTCLRMHNGSMLRYRYTSSFAGTGTTNAVWFEIDPDGKVTDGIANGPGKTVMLFYSTMEE